MLGNQPQSLNGSIQYKGSAIPFKTIFTNPPDSNLDFTGCQIELVLIQNSTDAELAVLTIGSGIDRITDNANLQEVRVSIPASTLIVVPTPAEILYYFRLTVNSTPLISDQWRGSFRLRSMSQG